MKLLKYLFTQLFALPILVLLFVLTSLPAFADQAYFDTSNRVFLVTKGAQKMTLGIGTGGTGAFEFIYAGTPVARIDATGFKPVEGFGITQNIYSAVFVATATPGTNILKPGYNIPAGTPTADTQVLVGSATVIPGAVYNFFNSSGVTLFAKAPAGVTVNGATAGGRVSVATLISLTCIASSATNLDCRLNVNPTPAAA